MIEPEQNNSNSPKNCYRWKELKFWRNLSLIFLASSYLGHYIEMLWTLFLHYCFGQELANNILNNPFEPYTVYGLGALACALLFCPIVKKTNNIVIMFALITIVCAIIEYFSSISLVITHGHNPNWNYGEQPFNLHGHIVLHNSLLFGLLGLIFTRYIYPATVKIFSNTNEIILNVLFLALMIAYASFSIFN